VIYEVDVVVDAEEEGWHHGIVVLVLLNFIVDLVVVFFMLVAIATIPSARSSNGGGHGRRKRWVGGQQQTAVLIVAWRGWCSLLSLFSPLLHSSYALPLPLLPLQLLPPSLLMLLDDSAKRRRIHFHHGDLKGHLGGIVLRPSGGEKEDVGAPMQAAGTVLQNDARGQGAEALSVLASWWVHGRGSSTSSNPSSRPIVGGRGPLRRKRRGVV